MLAENNHDEKADQLAQKVKLGDEEALASYFELLSPRLLHIVKVNLHPGLSGRVDPADILQESYIDLSKRFCSYSDRQDSMAPFVWVRLVVMERLLLTQRQHLQVRARDALREATRASTNDDTKSNVLANCLIARVTSVNGRMIRQEMADAVFKAIDGLSEADQQVISLRVFEELSNAEVAAVLQLSENGASSRFVRAMTRLKHALQTVPEVQDFMTKLAR